ncbi:hypothetical protein TNCV_3580971 [Trichonephila clavipes]|nr:hypothetical protein TNCV_3580971 [Trichonephila clavipes]
MLVWGVIMLNGLTELNLFDNASFPADPVKLFFHKCVFSDIPLVQSIFLMDDNALPYRPSAVEEFLESERIYAE